jgi:hypothetical protein
LSDHWSSGGQVRPSRVERGARARLVRRSIVAGIVGALTVVALGAYLAGRGGGGPPPAASDLGGETNAPTRSMLLALQVTGGPAPLLAVVGVPNDAAPFYMPLSTELNVVVPGQGETSAAGVAALPGDSMRVALSNVTGSWIDHFAVLSLGDLGAAVDEAGGLTVNLPDAYPTAIDVFGPGEVTLNGGQVKAFLKSATGDARVRWEIVLGAMLADPLRVVTTLTSDTVETDDAEAVNAIVARAGDAEALDMPTKRINATIVLPVFPTLDGLLSASLGSPTPVSAIVQNGSGEPGVGEAVAVRIIPAGFRVVLSQNAEKFDVTRTEVFANGAAHEEEARAIKAALGVGRVRVSAVPSNVGDITIVVGKDFTA